jgi:putative acetyltransferase
MAEIMGDPQVFAGLLQLPYATEAAWRKRIEEMPTGPNTPELFLIAERGGRIVGNAGVHPALHVRRRHTAGIGMAVARDAQGQGVGSALMAAIVDWADNWAQLLRLELTVYTDNQAGLALYRKFGFVAEGTHRAYAMRDGVYVDAVCMARLHPNPPQLPQA